VLKASGITRDEAVDNPQAVLDILAFHMEGPAPKLPSRMTLKRNMAAAANIKHEDPLKSYKDLKKLGQGASGVVFSAVHKKTNERVRDFQTSSTIVFGSQRIAFLSQGCAQDLSYFGSSRVDQ